MKEKYNLYKSFNIESNEVAPVFLLITQSVFLGIFYGTFDIGAHTLFLKTFPDDMIPKAYIISGIVGIIMTSIFSTYQSKIRFSTLSKYTLLFISLLTILIRIFFEFSAAKWTVFLVFILLGPLNILAILAFWGTVSRIFSLRQGKRLYGIIDSGQVFGIIISSYAIPLIITYLNGTKNLLVISSVSIIVAMVVEMIISKKYNLDIETDGSKGNEATEQEQMKLVDFAKNPYILYMALFVVFSMFTAFFVQYSFLVVTNEQYPVEDDLAKFLGFFTGSMMIFTFVIKTFVYSKLMKTYGLKISLMLSSLLLLAFTGLAILVGLLSGYQATSAGFIYFFLLISLSKLFNKTLKDALEVPSFKLLYQSLKKSIRFDIQAKIDGTINEIAALISGLLLGGLGLLVFIKLIHFYIFLFALLAIWSFITIKLYKEYRKSLEESLKATTESDYEGKTHILSNEITSNAQKLNNKLDSIKSFAPDLYLPYLLNTFDHSNQERIESLKKIHLVELFLNQIKTGKKYQIAWNPESKLIKDLAIKELANLLASSEKSDYLKAIYFVLNIEEKPRINTLLALMRIPNTEVQQFAIRISGTIQETEVINTIAEFLDSKLLLPDTIISLKQMVTKSFKTLIQMFYKTDIELNNQLALMEIITQVQTEETEQFLLDNLNYHKKEIRKKAIDSLKSMNYSGTEKDYPKLFHAVTQAAQDVSWDISALAAYSASNISNPLYKALEFEYFCHQDILLKLLAITYDAQSVEHVTDHLNSGTAEGVGYALELFDLFLAEEIKPFILAIFEDLPFYEKSQLLESFFPVRVPELNELIIQIINRDPNLISKTTKQLALQEYTTHFQSVTDDLIAQVFNPETELQVLSSQIVKELNPSKFNQIKTRLKPAYRRNIDQGQSKVNYPIQKILMDFYTPIQKTFGINTPDFIDFFNQLNIIEFEKFKNIIAKEQVANYFVFLIIDQNNIDQNETILELFEKNESIPTNGDYIVGITKEAMSNLMLTQKHIVHNLINLI